MHLVDFHTHSQKGSHKIDKGNNEKYEDMYRISPTSCRSNNKLKATE